MIAAEDFLVVESVKPAKGKTNADIDDNDGEEAVLPFAVSANRSEMFDLKPSAYHIYADHAYRQA